MKIGLYSITYLGVWYRGGALSLEEFIKQTKKLGYSGIEIDGKRPHGNPMDLSAGARREIKQMTADEGLDMVAVASNNDFCSLIPEHRECQLLMVREQIKLAADLGAPIVRLFVGWPGIVLHDGLAHYDIAARMKADSLALVSRAETWEFARDCFREAACIAEQEGVTLVLQDHHPVIRDHNDVMSMIAQVNSPAFKACLDVPLFPRQDDEWVAQAVQAGGSQQIHTHYNGEFQRDSSGKVVQKPLAFYKRQYVNYPAFVRELKKIGYTGYHCFEFCHEAYNDLWEPQGREYVDEQAALALEYLKDIMVAEGVYEQ